jgi:hypothetical protein
LVSLEFNQKVYITIWGLLLTNKRAEQAQAFYPKSANLSLLFLEEA